MTPSAKIAGFIGRLPFKTNVWALFSSGKNIRGKNYLMGFTLLELMVVVGVLGVVVTGLLGASISCLLLNESNNSLVKAVNDAQYVLEQVKGLPYSSISSYSVPLFNNLTNEDVTITSSVGLNIAEVTVNVSWTERQRGKDFSLTTRIAK